MVRPDDNEGRSDQDFPRATAENSRRGETDIQHLRFLIEGRGDQQHTALEIRQLFQSGQLTHSTQLSRDGKQWFAAVQLLNRMPDEKTPPPTPVLR
ncbi:MAG: hypothetical protein JNJ54_13260 [Myxococcaceae bacterium]|nr:hypothetical protein [Myxococcaceae bacterium]